MTSAGSPSFEPRSTPALLDTADAYCLDESDVGHNERLIVRALAGRAGERSRITVATKGGMAVPGRVGERRPGEALARGVRRQPCRVRRPGARSLPASRRRSQDTTRAEHPHHDRDLAAGVIGRPPLRARHAEQPAREAFVECDRHDRLRCLDRADGDVAESHVADFAVVLKARQRARTLVSISGAVLDVAWRRGVALDRSAMVGTSAADRTMAERIGARFEPSTAFFR